jgi:MinD-like ATPase involved in chromosome partitioning or flagellar assembly
VARAGQRLGPLDAPTAEVERLALWLRQLTRDYTQRQLAERVGGGRTRWGSYLKGRVLISYPVLKQLVRVVVEPQQQHKALSTGRELLDAARASFDTPGAALAAQASREPEVLAQQLRATYKAHEKSQKALLGTTQLVHGLLRMVAALQERCDELEDAAEVAAVQAEVRAYAWAEDQLRESERLLDLAVAALERARSEREQAEELRAAAEHLGERHRRALASMQTAADAWQAPPLVPDASPTLPVEAFDAALQQAQEALGAHALELREARDSMGLPQPGTEESVIVRGHIVDNTAGLTPGSGPASSATGTESAARSADDDTLPPPNPADRLDDSLFETSHAAPVPQGPVHPTQTPVSARRMAQSGHVPVGYIAAVELSSDRLVRQRRPRSTRRNELARSRQHRLLGIIRTPVLQERSIVVVSAKGGVGKTTTVMALGSVFAACRMDKVLALDVNPDTGTLGRRLRRETGATIRDLIQALPCLRSYLDIRRFTSQNPEGLEVLANDVEPSVAAQLTPAEYTDVLNMMGRQYPVMLTDTGTALTHPVTQEALARADQLIVVAAPNVDGAGAASITLDILQQGGYQHLVNGAVLLINASHGSGEGIDVSHIASHFETRCRAVASVPFDEHLAHGAEISLDLMRAKTRQAYMELAAAVAETFPGWPET